jgi:hypothetical protein
MAHQTVDGGFGRAHPVSFDTTAKEPVDTSPSDIQPPGVDKEDDFPQSLEEALLGE